jgi:xanthine dehydrogenase YagT iron-sulfur-binding subunit
VAAAGGVALTTTTAFATDTATAPVHRPGRDLPPGGTLLVTLRVNDETLELMVDPRTSLLDVLREQAGLTGSKKGCDRGACGACTVHIDGRRVISCLTLAVRCHGKQITTIEGLAEAGHLHPVQAAFMEHDGFQCGYCTPGQIMSAVALIKEGHAGSDTEIREWMSGNICRCGAYPNIVAAVRQAAGEA